MFLLSLIFIALISSILVKGIYGIKSKSISIFAFYRIFKITGKHAVNYSIFLFIISGSITILFLILLFLYFRTI